ncbi:hypothetical protein RR48_08464 [Papilio machaon]|uniref:Uncharacterized protein n=1 Tax=Papilio machaon TaxID=76193 RepID=A0A194QV69_PAPMA|nr:hypothetical protein RR48_08464 [Papilio machaon]
MEDRRHRLTRTLCVNCNICVNTLRRYLALTLDPRVTSLICSWVYPQIITEEDVVCEACRDLAMFAVNENLQQEVSNSGEQAGPSHRGHAHVCLLCGCSIARRQSDKILKDSPTDLQRSIIAIIESRVAIRPISESDRVCHACWLRTKRESQRMNRIDDARSQQSVPEVTQSQDFVSPDQSTLNVEIILPNYRRAANTNNHCVFPHCSNTTLRGISDQLRAIVLNSYHYYLPELARICDEHLESYTWDTLFDSDKSISTFTARQIQHVFSFVNAFNPTLDFKNIEEMDERLFIYLIGYTKEKFNTLLEEVPRVKRYVREP